MITDDEVWLTVDEVAARLRVSAMTIYRMCREPNNPLNAIVVGRRTYRVPRSGLDAYLRRQSTR